MYSHKYLYSLAKVGMERGESVASPGITKIIFDFCFFSTTVGMAKILRLLAIVLMNS